MTYEQVSPVCDVAGCHEPYEWKGLCRFHLARVRVGLPLEPRDDEDTQ